MKIAYFHDHSDDVDIRSVMTGEAASSGSVASVVMFEELAKGHEVTVFHRMANQADDLLFGITWIRVGGSEEVARRVCELSRNKELDVIVIRNHAELSDLSDRISDCKVAKVVMMNNDLRPEDMRKLVSKGFSAFIARSSASADYYRYMDIGRFVDVIPHALPHKLQESQNIAGYDKAKVIWVGATREEKGFHHILRAWPLVRERVPSARLEVYGSIKLHKPDAEVGPSGVLEPNFEKQHLDTIVPDGQSPEEIGIVFHGARGKIELQEAAHSAAVGVVNLNTRRATETFCISAVELQAAGCPCVGGRAGGLKDTISDGQSGILVDRENPRKIAHAVVRLLTDAEERARMSRGAREHASRYFDMAVEAARWDVALRKAIAGENSAYAKNDLVTNVVRRSSSLLLGRAAAKLKKLLS